jgi:hypothetical protein
MKKLAATLLCCALVGVAADTANAKPNKNLRCPSMRHVTKDVAREIGWDKTRKIDFIMWRESRCNPKALNPDDPYGGSLGLFQINQFWCKPSRSTGDGILVGWNVLDDCRELYKPRTAAEAFVAIYDYVDEHYGDGWIPWGGEPWT